MATTVFAAAASSWAVLMGIAPLLQIRRMLQERSSREVSVGYFAILLVGAAVITVALWLRRQPARKPSPPADRRAQR